MQIVRKLTLATLCLTLSAAGWAQAASQPTQPAPATAAPASAEASPAAPSSAEASPAAPSSATQSTALPAAPEPQAQEEPRQKTSQEILDEEKKQRMLGIVPMYGVTNYHYAPALTKGQKFDLMARSYITVFPYLAAAFQAGWGQATNSFEGYGQGASGYGKRFGAALADGADSAFWSNYMYPVIFKQDPRYFRSGEGTKKQRIWYAMEHEFITKKDSDRKPVFSYSNVLGALTAGTISNAYYPQEERGFGLTMSRTAVSFGWGMVGNLILEFWPDVSKGLMRKHKSDTVPIK
jgi:hypothetical protein